MASNIPALIPLIGSRTEEQCRIQLLKSRENWLNKECHPRLKRALSDEGFGIEGVLVIGWTPDQGEDIYTVLAPPDTIVFVEIDRVAEAHPIVESIPLATFQKKLSQRDQIELAVAFEILGMK